jgi:hypothetical protein
MFKVGQKIVCVDASPNEKVANLYQEWVVKYKEYTVRRAEGSLDGIQRILLEEVRNSPVFFPALGGKAEPGFAATRFKTVESLLEEESVEEEMENLILN